MSNRETYRWRRDAHEIMGVGLGVVLGAFGGMHVHVSLLVALGIVGVLPAMLADSFLRRRQMTGDEPDSSTSQASVESGDMAVMSESAGRDARQCCRCGRSKKRYPTMTPGKFALYCSSFWCRAIKYLSWTVHGITGGRHGGYDD